MFERSWTNDQMGLMGPITADISDILHKVAISDSVDKKEELRKRLVKWATEFPDIEFTSGIETSVEEWRCYGVDEDDDLDDTESEIEDDLE